MCQNKVVMAHKGYERQIGCRYLVTKDEKLVIEAYISKEVEERAKAAYEDLWKKSQNKTLKQLIHDTERRYKVKIKTSEMNDRRKSKKASYKKIYLEIS